MAKLLKLFIVSAALIFSSVFSKTFLDIQQICDQTPDITLFGEFLRQNPSIYDLYQARRNSTFYIPSDKALEDFYRNTGSVFRRATANETAKALLQIEVERSSLANMRNRQIIKRTADTTTSPNGNNSVIVTVNGSDPDIVKRQLNASAGSRAPGIKVFTGAGKISNILFGDIESIQGLVHVVDTLFTLPEPVTDTLAYTNRTKFLKSINAAGLGEKYNTEGQITVFAPIDSAFLNQSTLDTAAIGYHVINDIALYTPLLTDGSVHQTAQGSNLYVTVVDGEYFINCVRVVQTNVITDNGVIHAIETILSPLSTPPTCGKFPPSPVQSAPPLFTGTASTNTVNIMAALGFMVSIVFSVL